MSAASTIATAIPSRKSPILSDREIEQIANGTSAEIAEWIVCTAEARGISYRSMPSDRFARAVSRLSDAETDLDHIEELLIALSRSQVITPYQLGLLQLHYLLGQMQQAL